MIKFENVYKQYNHNGVKTDALNDINLVIDKGDIFGIIGYSGAGKSTLLRLINHLESPTKGEVIVENQYLNQLNEVSLRLLRSKIGMIFQHFNLLESKTVFDNIAIPLILTHTNKQTIKKRVEELLEFIELSDKANHYPKELSGGQKQRVGIARALANQPDILLCDEATSALDPKTTQSILSLLQKVNQQYQITIVLITHEMQVIKQICNKVAVMEKGNIIEQGKVVDVFASPKQLTTQQFISSIITDEIPTAVVNNLLAIDDTTSYPLRLFKLEFLGRSASEPVINQLILQKLVVVNILFAQMSEIDHRVLGSMFIQLKGEHDSITQAINYLRHQDVQVTELKH